MGIQMLESVSHDLKEVDLLINGVGDGTNVTDGGTQKTGVRRVNDPGFWERGQHSIPRRLVPTMTSDLRWFTSNPSSAASCPNTPKSCTTSSRFPPR